MITGFNTDIEHNGVTYHVQTEDKGLDKPLILSLVYTGGEILASKRSPYDDLIASGFDEKVLTDRLNRQHKLICAAISQGRIDDLRRMSRRDTEEKRAPLKEPLKEEVDVHANVVEVVAPIVTVSSLDSVDEPLLEIPVAVVDETDEVQLETSIDELVESPEMPEILRTQIQNISAESDTQTKQNTLKLRLFDERQFHGGERVDLKIQVTNGANHPLAGAEIMVKILGSAFRPLIFHAASNEKGAAVVNLQLPRFRSGRAALLVRAKINDEVVELRRIIIQG